MWVPPAVCARVAPRLRVERARFIRFLIARTEYSLLTVKASLILIVNV